MKFTVRVRQLMTVVIEADDAEEAERIALDGFASAEIPTGTLLHQRIEADHGTAVEE